MKPFLTKKGRESIIKTLGYAAYHDYPYYRSLFSRIGGFIRPSDEDARSHHMLLFADKQGQSLNAGIYMCDDAGIRGLPLDTFVPIKETGILLSAILEDADAARRKA